MCHRKHGEAAFLRRIHLRKEKPLVLGFLAGKPTLASHFWNVAKSPCPSPQQPFVPRRWHVPALFLGMLDTSPQGWSLDVCAEAVTLLSITIACLRGDREMCSDIRGTNVREFQRGTLRSRRRLVLSEGPSVEAKLVATFQEGNCKASVNNS